MAEHLSRSAWDRLMEKVDRPWDQRLEAVEAAREQLRWVDRSAARLILLDQQLRRLEDARDAARRDLVDLDRRRDLAIQRAADEAGKVAKWNRTAKMDAARERETDWQDQATSATRRTIVSRMATAEREIANLHQERSPLGRSTVLPDAALVDWLRGVLTVVEQTHQRDRAARAEIVDPWERQREVSLAVAHQLQARHGDDVVINQAFGEGAIHVIAGARLAVIEVRTARGPFRVDVVGDTTNILETRPDGDAAVGVTDGSTTRLREATARVAGATGGRPAPIVCITGWKDAPRVEGGVVLCGPSNLADVIAALPETDHSPSCLAAAAGQLSQIPLPSLLVRTPPSLAHLRPIALEEVPEELEHLRELVAQAHRAPAHQAQARLAHSPTRVLA